VNIINTQKYHFGHNYTKTFQFSAGQRTVLLFMEVNNNNVYGHLVHKVTEERRQMHLFKASFSKFLVKIIDGSLGRHDTSSEVADTSRLGTGVSCPFRIQPFLRHHVYLTTKYLYHTH